MAVKKYSLRKDGEKSLSPHFKVKEFRCKDGSDKILIESELIDLLEKVYEHFDCLKINISSGYRTATHDKKVGGKGSGSHVEGKAADFTAYRKNGSPISSKEVCLYLEDLGIIGIGYRSGGSETSSHADINYRKRKWYGDEKYSFTKSIGNSFYPYFNIKYRKYMAIANVNIRREPSLKGETAGLLKIGRYIAVADTEKIRRDGFCWAKVIFEGKPCYIADRYLKEASE